MDTEEWIKNKNKYACILKVWQENAANGFRCSPTTVGDRMRRSSLVPSVVSDETVKRLGYWRHDGHELRYL